MTTTDELGGRVRAVRQARGLTPMQVARAAGVTRVWLSRLERGRVPHPDTGTLVRLAEAMGLTLSDLLDQQPAPRGSSGTAMGPVAPSAGVEEPDLVAAQDAVRNLLTPVVGYLQLLARHPRALAGRSSAAVLEDEVLPRCRELLDVIDGLQVQARRPSSTTG